MSIIKIKHIVAFVVSFFNFSLAKSQQAYFVTASNNKIQPTGRIAIKKSDGAEIYWPGSGFILKFKGTSAKAVLKDEKGSNYFNVIVDDKLINVIKIDTVKKSYTIAQRLSNSVHTLEIRKRADWYRGKTWFYGFELPPGSKLFTAQAKNRRIEFFGNSITVGAVVEDTVGDSGDSTFTNNFKSYASITAKYFNADYYCTSTSGIGILISWGKLPTMPEIYDRVNPADSISKWDFSKAPPEIVVINLLQNDSWLVKMPERKEFKKKFGANAPSEDSIIYAYSSFVQKIRKHYPEAYIVCLLGPMDAVQPGSQWPVYIEKAVTSLNDKKVLTHFFTYRDFPGHPKTETQKEMAEELIKFIEQQTNWKKRH